MITFFITVAQMGTLRLIVTESGFHSSYYEKINQWAITCPTDMALRIKAKINN